MEHKTVLITALFAVLLLGAAFVAASGYYSMSQLHARMTADDSFSAMNAAMLNGDYAAAEQYHQVMGVECPMHDAVVSGDISLDDFATMHEWMMTGQFPTKKPAGLSDAAWALHLQHHPQTN